MIDMKSKRQKLALIALIHIVAAVVVGVLASTYGNQAEADLAPSNEESESQKQGPT